MTSPQGKTAPAAGTVRIEADGVSIRCQPGVNLLEVLRAHEVDLPCPCFTGKPERRLRCGLCLVEVEGSDEPLRACELTVDDGLQVRTRSPALTSARAQRLEQLFAEHYREELCEQCIWHGGCELHVLARRWQIDPRFTRRWQRATHNQRG